MKAKVIEESEQSDDCAVIASKSWKQSSMSHSIAPTSNTSTSRNSISIAESTSSGKELQFIKREKSGFILWFSLFRLPQRARGRKIGYLMLKNKVKTIKGIGRKFPSERVSLWFFLLISSKVPSTSRNILVKCMCTLACLRNTGWKLSFFIF